MKQIGGFVIICLILTSGYLLGLLKFLTENEDDRCEMTYMFEYPQYVKITNKLDKIIKKYGLYAYSEGRLTERTRNMQFDGIPVLFITGNAGSYKQVRSLASVALRKWLNSRIQFHFDYFTVDLNEEYTGLYGPLLYSQLEYVKVCLYRVLELYNNKQKSIILIGHSMGGIIAMKLLSEIDSDLIPIVITLATPLKRAPIVFDYHLEKFYQGIFVDMNSNSTSVINIDGGYRDYLIAPYLTEIRNENFLHIGTSNIPISWTESNHVQILWCKQVVMAINRALFDIVNLKNKQISGNLTLRDNVFRHHFVQHSGIKIRNFDHYSKSVQLKDNGKWMENLHKQYSLIYPNGVKKIHWYMISITNFRGYEKLSIFTVNLDIVDWVFVCNAYYFTKSSRICREATHLTHKTEIIPSIKHKRRFFHTDLSELKKQQPEMTHVVFKVFPTDEPLEYHIDIHGKNERKIRVDLPRWYSFKNQLILDKTDEKSIFYELELIDLNHILQYYKLYLEPLNCLKNTHHASITLSVPWTNQDYHGFITNSMKKPFNIRLYSPKPVNFPTNSSAVIKLILDPVCTYQISIEASFWGNLGQFARIYSPLLLANIAAIALMTFSYQLEDLKEKKSCSIVFVAIQQGAKPFVIFSGYNILSNLLNINFLPKPDHIYLINDGIDFIMMQFFLYLTSIGIFWIFAIIFTISLIALESTAHKLFLKFLARTVSFNLVFSEYLLSFLQKIPVLVALILITLSLTTCGGLALCLGTIFYFLKLTQMSQDFVESIVWYFIKKIAKYCKSFIKKTKTNKNPAIVQQENHLQIENDSKSSDKCDNDKEIDIIDNNDDDDDKEIDINEELKTDDVNEEGIEIIKQDDDDKPRLDINNDDDETFELSSSYNNIFFHSTIFLIWFIITLINIPAVLTWAHNFKYNNALVEDNSMLPGVILSFSSLALWQLDFPKNNKKWMGILQKFVTIMAVFCVVFATISVYRLNYFLSLTLLVVILHQIFAPNLDENPSIRCSDDETKQKFSDLKSKLE